MTFPSQNCQPIPFSTISQSDEDQATEWLKTRSPQPVLPPQLTTKPTRDQQIVACIRRRLHEAGSSTHNAFTLSMTTNEGQTLLAGWSLERWDRASVTQNEKDPLSPLTGLTGSNLDLKALPPADGVSSVVRKDLGSGLKLRIRPTSGRDAWTLTHEFSTLRDKLVKTVNVSHHDDLANFGDGVEATASG